MKLSKFLLPVLVVAGFAVYLSLFVVKEINQAIVLQFGDPKKVIVQPGGSIRDKESIALANKAKIKMIFTGIRHFNH